MKQLIVIFLLVLSQSACQLLPSSTPAPVYGVNEPQLCLSETKDCDLMSWFDYWINAVQLDWTQRKAQLKALGHTDKDKLQKILLSQGPATPYQDRLRAKYLAQELSSKYQGQLGLFIRHLLLLPNKEKLELESALTTMGRINARQAGQIEQQISELDKQKQQIRQLLKVEAQMLDKQRGNDD